MPSTPLAAVLLSCPTTSGESHHVNLCCLRNVANTCPHRLLDKIAKQILVCENQTIRQWDSTIGDYKNYLRKKMISAGAV